MNTELLIPYRRFIGSASIMFLAVLCSPVHGQVSSNEKAALRAQGQNRAIAAAISTELKKTYSGKKIDRDALLGFLERLPSNPENVERTRRKELALKWKDLADLVLHDEGQSELYLVALRTSLSFDPENLEVRRELEIQQRRQEIYRKRLEAAEAYRKQKGVSK